VSRGIAPREDAGMHPRVEGLDAPVEHFGEAGVVGDLGYRDAVLGKQFRRAARGQDLDLELSEPEGELAKAGLVRYADQCGADGDLHSLGVES